MKKEVSAEFLSMTLEKEYEGIYSILKMKEYARQVKYILDYLEAKSQYS